MSHLISLLDFSRPLAFMFDLDGTILDSTRWHMQAYLETLDIYAPCKVSELNEAGEAIIKRRRSEDVFLALGFTGKEVVAKLVEHKRELYKAFIQNGNVCLFPRVKDLIDYLKSSKHRTLIFMTNSNNNTATLCLEAHGLNEKFNDIVTEEQVVRGKPAPDIFQYALRRSKLEPSQAVTIEDSEIGIQASIAAGVPACLVNHEEDLPNVPVFGSVTKLYDRIRSDFEKAEKEWSCY